MGVVDGFYGRILPSLFSVWWAALLGRMSAFWKLLVTRPVIISLFYFIVLFMKECVMKIE
jgi:hypothetical protein